MNDQGVGPRFRRLNVNRYAWLNLATPLAARFPAIAYGGADVIGSLLWHAKRRSQRQRLENLLPFCDDDRESAARAAREARRNIARYWVDVVAMPGLEVGRFERERVRVFGTEHLQALEVPGPVVVVGAHTGNGELCLQLSRLGARPRVALIEPLSPRDLRETLLKLRSGGEVCFCEATFHGIRQCAAALDRGELLGIMGDRDIQGGGVPVQLAGRRVRIARGPWQLAWRHDALILPVFCSRRSRTSFDLWVMEPTVMRRCCDEEDAIHEAAQSWASMLEAHLRRNPGQWLVQEDFWAEHGCVER